MSAVVAYGVSAPLVGRIGGGSRCARGGASWSRRCVHRRAHLVWSAADVETIDGTSEESVLDCDDDRFVYVGNFDFFTQSGVVECAMRDLLGGELSQRVLSMAVPGWRDKILQDGTLKPRKKRDLGKQNRGFAVVEFDDPSVGRQAAEKLNGLKFESRELRASPGVSTDVCGVTSEESEKTDEEMKSNAEAEFLRKQRRGHNSRQKKRRKQRDDSVLEQVLDDVLSTHPSVKGNAFDWKKCTVDPSATVEWWDDESWRKGWGVLYSRWRDVNHAKKLGQMDWINCPPSIDPTGRNKKGGVKRGERKRLQVESFRAVLNATRANEEMKRNEDDKLVVVDFGCGTGNLLLPLAHAEPSINFTGVDLNHRSVEILRERAASAGLKNVEGRVGLAETFDGACDVALALHVCGGGTDAVLLQAQVRNAAFVVAPCCVGKLKDGGLKSIVSMKKDLKDGGLKNISSPSEDDDGESETNDDSDDVIVTPGGGLPNMRVIHPRSRWMRGVVQRPQYLEIAAKADWSGHQGVDPSEQSKESESLGRLPRAAKAAVECDRAAAAAECGYAVRVMKMTHAGAGLKNDLIVGFPFGEDPLRDLVEGTRID